MHYRSSVHIFMSSLCRVFMLIQVCSYFYRYRPTGEFGGMGLEGAVKLGWLSLTSSRPILFYWHKLSSKSARIHFILLAFWLLSSHFSPTALLGSLRSWRQQERKEVWRQRRSCSRSPPTWPLVMWEFRIKIKFFFFVCLFSKEKLETSYANGKALNNTMAGELDDTIDPADTRAWILMALESNPAMHKRRHGKKRPSVSTW